MSSANNVSCKTEKKSLNQTLTTICSNSSYFLTIDAQFHNAGGRERERKLPDELTIGSFGTITVERANISETRTVIIFGDGKY